VNFAQILPAALVNAVPANVQGTGIPVGIDCTPISVLGVGGNKCEQQTVCCTNNEFVSLSAARREDCLHDLFGM